MKAKLAIGLVLILVLQISSSMPDVDQLEEPITENKSQINSPQGVNSTVFMPVSGPRMDFYYSDGRSMTFGDDLLVAFDYGDYTNPKFGFVHHAIRLLSQEGRGVLRMPKRR